jgi:hypothetical protein
MVAEGTTPSLPAEPALPAECAAARDALYRRAEDEELKPDEAKALDEHLAECDDCAAELRRAGAFSTNIAKLLSGLKPPADIRRKVLGRIEPFGGRRRMIIGATALGAVALVGVAVIMLSREAPIARIASADGDVSVLAFTGREWRQRAQAVYVRGAERVEVAPATTATLKIASSKVVLAGPALIQLERTDAGVAIHCIHETSLLVSVPGLDPVEIVAGGVRVVVTGASASLKVSSDATCRLEVREGEVRATDASGERTIKAGESAILAQPGKPRDR